MPIDGVLEAIGVGGLISSVLLAISISVEKDKHVEIIPLPDGQTYLVEGWYEFKDIEKQFLEFLADNEEMNDVEIQDMYSLIQCHKSYYIASSFGGEFFYTPAKSDTPGAMQVTVIDIP